MRHAPPAVLLGLVLLAGCTSSADPADPAADASPPAAAPVPDEAAFAEGTCRLVAPDVRAVGSALDRLGEGGEVDQAVEVELQESQDRVFAVAEAAEPELKPALTDLVEKIGVVRIRAVGKNYEPELGEQLRRAYDGVVDVCT